MCIRVPYPIDALLSMFMGEGETLYAYSNQYWELYNKIGGNNKEVAMSTFKLGLPLESKLRGFLIKQLLVDTTFCTPYDLGPYSSMMLEF